MFVRLSSLARLPWIFASIFFSVIFVLQNIENSFQVLINVIWITWNCVYVCVFVCHFCVKLNNCFSFLLITFFSISLCLSLARPFGYCVRGTEKRSDFLPMISSERKTCPQPWLYMYVCVSVCMPTNVSTSTFNGITKINEIPIYMVYWNEWLYWPCKGRWMQQILL